MPQPEELYRMLKRQPFEPFRLHLTDGRVFDIRYPHMNMVGTTWIRIGILAPDDPDPDPVPDHTIKVPIARISRVESLATLPSSPTR